MGTKPGSRAFRNTLTSARRRSSSYLAANFGLYPAKEVEPHRSRQNPAQRVSRGLVQTELRSHSQVTTTGYTQFPPGVARLPGSLTIRAQRISAIGPRTDGYSS